MDKVGAVFFHILVTMSALLFMSLLMGKRHLGELSPLDFIVSITIGTVAGASIADPESDLFTSVAAIILLGLFQVIVSWIALKNRKLQHKVNFEPTVLVENGTIIKGNLKKVRLPVEILLQMLREKEVFDINEIELAIFEPQGKLSVLKKPEFQPIKPYQLNIAATPNQILTPVILEGELQTDILKQMGFSTNQIDEFREQNKDRLDNVFVAFMDKNRKLYVINESAQENGVFLH